ncbi:eukaryotic translation initiation factor 4 gamma 3-like [Aethina tumida]|uniref:eukaryotic translation initiation factor 4 gamma 3-like n=1 Tax=Aethina tumida TaxID=116153 RepID=UPI0021498796|nr:eukaryotic translation initiation factor 4 gamma 3-like [Aethina tumida]
MFSITYAIVCRELALLDVRLADTSSKNPEFVSFRKLLVIRCRTEFETLSVNDNERTLKLNEIEECTLAEEKKNMQLKLKNYDRKVRRKSLGIVRFIGELFKQQMLTANMMIRCLSNFLTYDHEISVECLCTLLRTVGKKLESKSVNLDHIFKAVSEIVEGKHQKVSNRLRFMLQDVIDLRCSNWISGRQSEEDHTRVELYIKLRAILNRLTLNFICYF